MNYYFYGYITQVFLYKSIKKWAFNYFQVKCSIFVRSIIALRQRFRHSLFQTPSEPNASLFLA